MLYEYDFRADTDRYEEMSRTGLEVDLDKENNIKFPVTTYGEFGENKINSYEELRKFISEHYKEINEDYNYSKFTREELIDELLEIIDSNLMKEVA